MAQQLEERLAQATQPGESRELAGAVVAFSKADGSKTYLKSFGNRTLDSADPLPEDTVFWLVSMTKLPTAIAVLQCVDRGLFQLDSAADVVRLLPEWEKPVLMTDIQADRVATDGHASRAFTVRELLNHSNGIGADGAPPLSIWRKQRGEKSKWLSGHLIDSYLVPLQFEPGTAYKYGGGYEWLGLMIERATNTTLDKYFEEHIFRPLGIRDMTFDLESRPDLAARVMKPLTRPKPGAPLEPGVVEWMQRGDGKDKLGGLGLHGTAAEYLKILQSLLQNDGKVLKPKDADLLMQGHLSSSAKAAMNKTMTNVWARRVLAPGFKWEGPWNMAFGGAVIEEAAPGLASQDTFQWNGAPHCFWAIDRNAGFCSLFLTEVYPPADEGHDNLLFDVRKGIWTALHTA